LTFLRPAYTTADEKRRDLWAGVIGWFAINAILAIVTLAGWVPAWVGIVQLVANIALITLFAFTRRYVAIGALWAFAVALIATAVDAPVGTAACFAIGAGSNCEFGCTSAYAVGYGFGFLVGLIPGYFILRGVHRRLGK
jgi:hypothetical protein